MSIISIIAVGLLTVFSYAHGYIVGRKIGINEGKEEAFKKVFDDFNEWRASHVDYKCDKNEKIKIIPRYKKDKINFKIDD